MNQAVSSDCEYAKWYAPSSSFPSDYSGVGRGEEAAADSIGNSGGSGQRGAVPARNRKNSLCLGRFVRYDINNEACHRTPAGGEVLLSVVCKMSYGR